MEQETLKDKIICLAGRDLKQVNSDMHFDFNGKFLELPIIVNKKDVVEGVLCNRYGGSGYLAAPSPQVGCCVQCDFCDMSNLPYDGNLPAEVILEQIALILNRAMKFGYKVLEKPLKISFVKGGECFLNPEFPTALELIAENLAVPIKISTIFPNLANVHRIYSETEQFAASYLETIQMQVSLISTDKDFRQARVRVPLLPFEKLREYGESWRVRVPNPRKMTLSFTLTEKTPCEPQEIYSVLPPELFAVRIRDWMPTQPGIEAGLLSPTEKTVNETAAKFQDLGYQLVPGKPGSTEQKFKLTAGHIIKLYADLIKRNR